MKNKIRIFLIFNLITLLTVSTVTYSAQDNDVDNPMVYPGGEAFGIKMFSEGVIVTKTESFMANGKMVCPANDAGIQADDIIISADNISISSNNDFKNTIEHCCGKTIVLKIKRQDKVLSVNLTPVKNDDGKYTAGVWIKDSAAGLGTVTFYGTDTNCFSGLGHGICEEETGILMPLSYGDIEYACITSVTKSRNGKVGSINGYFTGTKIGTASKNNETGIYGIADISLENKEAIEIADKEEVKKGKAYILTTIEGSEPQKYEIEIVRIKRYDNCVNMVIEITDNNLLKETGGIVQGMSGSPIIQDEKLVGAVTHVLVDDVTKGYGIFAETMYEQMMQTS